MKTKELIAELKDIQEGIEGDNFTWGNIYFLIQKLMTDIQVDVVRELNRIISQIEGDRFTSCQLQYLISRLNK